MRIGLDFDNTIAGYDRSFHRAAVEARLVSADFSGGKVAVRDHVRSAHGDEAWQRLQGQVYGARMQDAVLIEGVGPFLAQCQARNAEVFIVSHKTEYGHFDAQKINLREAALTWMRAQGFFDGAGYGLSEGNVFFEQTRRAKVDRIGALNLDLFIDDLPEVFSEKTFPKSVRPILFCAERSDAARDQNIIACRSWDEIQDAVFEPGVSQLKRLAQELLAEPISVFKPIRGGGNNRMFRVETDRSAYALKVYPNSMIGQQDRMGAEISALTFLEDTGCPDVAHLVAHNVENRAVLFDWVNGAPVGVRGVSSGDIDAAVAFVERLFAASKNASARALPVAAEACLQPREIARQIEGRFERLAAPSRSHEGLDTYLSKYLLPLWRGLTWDDAPLLDRSFQTLSPSDFGFHNALRRQDGVLIFLDFEYFGWDDPAKLCCDFLLHPGMSLSHDLKVQFFAQMISVFAKGDPGFAARVRALYPMYGIRWCLILLNEFLPDRWRLRRLAGKGGDHAAALSAQLEKATKLLAHVAASIEDFPFNKGP